MEGAEAESAGEEPNQRLVCDGLLPQNANSVLNRLRTVPHELQEL